ncbi:hypothetical protein SARC_16811, partial [Sphaeroforma arctica JP610]
MNKDGTMAEKGGTQAPIPTHAVDPQHSPLDLS